jgi:hypothetical protein
MRLEGMNGAILRVVLTALVGVAFSLAASTGAFAGVRVTPLDRAATRAFLEARYAYERALVADAPASKTAVEGLASTLGRECPRVLAGAPQGRETLMKSFESRTGPPRSQSPRQRGEANRETEQLGALEGELLFALDQPLTEPDREAARAYARAVGSLRWSDNALTMFERTEAALVEWKLRSGPPNVCADMRAWVAGGYKTLSPATKTLIREQEAMIRLAILFLRELLAGFHNSDPLLLYEGPRARALVRKMDVVELELHSARKSLRAVERGLERTLGMASGAETVEAQQGPPKGAVEIGHGRTAARGSYTVWLEPKPGSSPSAPRCRLSMEVFETEADSNGGEGNEIDGTGVNEVCLSRLHPRAPSVQCRDGRFTIEAQTLPLARTVRLRLSDGREIVSRVAGCRRERASRSSANAKASWAVLIFASALRSRWEQNRAAFSAPLAPAPPVGAWGGSQARSPRR